MARNHRTTADQGTADDTAGTTEAIAAAGAGVQGTRACNENGIVHASPRVVLAVTLIVTMKQNETVRMAGSLRMCK